MTTRRRLLGYLAVLPFVRRLPVVRSRSAAAGSGGLCVTSISTLLKERFDERAVELVNDEEAVSPIFAAAEQRTRGLRVVAVDRERGIITFDSD